MPLKEFVQEHLDDAIFLHKAHAQHVIEELSKPKDLRNYNKMITDIGQMGYYLTVANGFCIDVSPPKQCVFEKKGNVVCFSPPKVKIPKEYRGCNIDPDDYKECRDYFEGPMMKTETELAQALKRNTI